MRSFCHFGIIYILKFWLFFFLSFSNSGCVSYSSSSWGVMVLEVEAVASHIRRYTACYTPSVAKLGPFQRNTAVKLWSSLPNFLANIWTMCSRGSSCATHHFPSIGAYQAKVVWRLPVLMQAWAGGGWPSKVKFWVHFIFIKSISWPSLWCGHGTQQTGRPWWEAGIQHETKAGLLGCSLWLDWAVNVSGGCSAASWQQNMKLYSVAKSGILWWVAGQ